MTRWYLACLFAFFLSTIALSACEPDMSALIHFRTLHGDTLLHAAVKSRRADALATFLELGCLTEAVDRERRTALWLASEKGEVDLMKILAKYGAYLKIRHGQFNETLLHVSAKYGRDLGLFWLLEAGFSTEVRDAMGWTPLHAAAVYGHGTTIRVLVGRGADVNAMEDAGETPLLKAVRLGRAPVAELLLALGAAPNATDLAGHTPLFWAERAGFSKIAALLREQVLK